MSEARTPPRRVTGDHVAREAGVSRATVSYVLNNAPNQTIPRSTREKVLSTAERLGYAPSAAARTLALGRSDVVVYLMPELPLNATVGIFLERLGSSLAARGLTLLVRPWARDAPPITALLGAVSPVALLVPDPLDAATVQTLRAGGVRAVTPVVDHNDFLDAQKEIGRVQAEALVAAGHTSLAGALTDDPRVAVAAARRFAGVREVCAERGLPAPVSAVVPLDVAQATEAVRGWRASAVTGVCAYDDDTALAVLAGMTALGLAAPRDLALVGVDDAASGRVSTPTLTTVVWDQLALADQAADAVASEIAGKPPRRRPQVASVRLIARGSV